MDCSTPDFPVLHHLLDFAQLMSIESVIPSNHLILCHPFSSCLQSFPASRSFPVVDSAHKVCKVLELQLQYSPSNEYSGLISFRIDWFELFAVQGTLKSLLQHHSSKASVLQHSAIFMVQLSHPCMITGDTIAWSIQIFVGKVMSLLFNTLSRFVTAFLPMSKHLNSMGIVIVCRDLGAQETKIYHYLTFSTLFAMK